MNDNKTDNGEFNDNIDLDFFVRLIIQRKKLVISFIASSFIIGCFTAFFLNDVYKSESVLTVVVQEEMNSGLSQLTSLTSLTNNAMSNRSSVIIETLKSRSFLKRLTEEQRNYALLSDSGYSVDSSGDIDFDPDYFILANNTWVANKPPFEEIYENYQDQLKIEYNKQTNILNLSFSHVSPQFSVKFLDLIISSVNEKLRKDDLEELQNTIELLKAEYVATQQLFVKNAISSIMVMNFQKEVRAKVKENYVLDPIEPPQLPEKKDFPNRILIILIFAIAGFIVSLLYLVARKIVDNYK